jgi:Chalcone isomerase-like
MPRQTHTLRTALVLACLNFVASVAPVTQAATGLPAAVPERAQLEKVGGGQLSWLGFDIYDASLWTGSGRYAGFGPGQTVALSLWYQRSFTREELLGITEKAWARLGRDAAWRQSRLASLRAVWTDVAPGHNMTTVVEAGGATRFYDAERLVGRIDDPEFGPAFLAIWLDPRSIVRDLRAKLLGDSDVTRASAKSSSN